MANSRTSWLTTIGWAAYLACSWTWCIGMFLPVLLVRDYGVWGFVVFAVPNVIGAAAMGWVLADAERARRLRERHLRAATAFSLVTFCFQLFFFAWIIHALRDAYGPASPPPGSSREMWRQIAVSAVTIPLFLGLLRGADITRSHKLSAAALWAVSAGIMGYLLVGGQLAFSPSSWPAPASTGFDLMLLAPVCVFGFAFSPYLDLTFLRAASDQSARANRLSFTLGFGVLFAAMIVFTLGYAWALMPVALGQDSGSAAPLIIGFVLTHIVLQLAFTALLHAREMVAAATRRGLFAIGAIALALYLGLVLATGSDFLYTPAVAGLTGGEVVYRGFMSFYGLVFPAYVWLCMIPTRDGHSGIDGPQGRRKLVVLAAAVVLAAPCYWLGFIELVEWWLVPGLAVVLLARVVVMMGVERGGPAGTIAGR